MADLIFYTNPQSRGRIVRWMLEEVGQPYETEIIRYDQMKSARYLAIHPLGKVPALKHREHVLTECAAICAYLADVFPDAGLGPRDDEKADYYRWFFYAAGPLEAAISNQAMGWQVPSAGCGLACRGKESAGGTESSRRWRRGSACFH